MTDTPGSYASAMKEEGFKLVNTSKVSGRQVLETWVSSRLGVRHRLLQVSRSKYTPGQKS